MITQTDPTLTRVLNETLARQRSLNLTLPKSVTIVGCGGVGSWIAMFLALAGVPTLYLWDNDEISPTNLNRLPLGPTFTNHNKAMALRDMLYQLTPQCNVFPFAAVWTPASQAEALVPEWIVAATDTWASRLAVFEWTKICEICANRSDDEQHTCPNHQPKCKYIEASAEGEYGGCTGEPATFASELEEAPGYASVPVHCAPCVASASMVTYHILHNIQLGSRNYRLGFDGTNIILQDFR